MSKKFLAIDYGERFIGLATYDLARDPYPLKHGRLAHKGEKNLLKDLKNLLTQEEITDVVVGVTYFTDGKESTNTKKIKNFLETLKKYCGDDFTYHEQDETLTSHEAKDRMLNSPEFGFKVDVNQIDALSAQIILEDFMKSFKS